METKNLEKVNDVTIQLVNENGQKLVPIRPICEALGIDHDVQNRKIKEDDFLSSVATLSVATGSDGKEYKMVCMPLKYVFGWLFTINPKNVKLEAQEAVTKYRIKCYDVLYNYFSEYAEYVEIRGKAIEKQLIRYQELQQGFKDARFNLDEAKKKMNQARSYTFDDYKNNKTQFRLEFLEEDAESKIGIEDADIEE